MTTNKPTPKQKALLLIIERNGRAAIDWRGQNYRTIHNGWEKGLWTYFMTCTTCILAPMGTSSSQLREWHTIGEAHIAALYEDCHRDGLNASETHRVMHPQDFRRVSK